MIPTGWTHSIRNYAIKPDLTLLSIELSCHNAGYFFKGISVQLS